MYYSLDRFEEELAVLEDDDEHTLTIPRILLPEGARPGDVLIRDGDRYSPAPTRRPTPGADPPAAGQTAAAVRDRCVLTGYPAAVWKRGAEALNDTRLAGKARKQASC